MKRRPKTYGGRRTGIWFGNSYREAMKVGDEWSLNHEYPSYGRDLAYLQSRPKQYIWRWQDIQGKFYGSVPEYVSKRLNDSDWVVVQPTNIYLYGEKGGSIAHGPALWDAQWSTGGRITGNFRAAGKWRIHWENIRR